MLTLLQSYSPTLNAILSDGSLLAVRPGSHLAPTLTLISRRSCVFRRVPLSGRTHAARKAAALKVEQELQFTAPRSFVSIDEDGAKRGGVWTWDTAPGGTISTRERALRGGVAALPEPVGREGMDQGVRLVRCLEGVEGEVWANKALVASRWWSEPPSSEEWALFVRSARVSGAGVPQMLPGGPPPLEEARWRTGFPRLQPDREAVAVTASPIRVAAFLAVAGLVCGAFYAARLGIITMQAAALEARIENGGESNARLAALRRSAQVRNAEAKALASIGDERRVLDTLTATLGALPTEQLQLQRVTFSTDELEIEAIVRSPVNGPALVAQLEENASILGAYVENADVGRLMIIRIKTTSPLAAAVSPALSPGGG